MPIDYDPAGLSPRQQHFYTDRFEVYRLQRLPFGDVELSLHLSGLWAKFETVLEADSGAPGSVEIAPRWPSRRSRLMVESSVHLQTGDALHGGGQWLRVMGRAEVRPQRARTAVLWVERTEPPTGRLG